MASQTQPSPKLTGAMVHRGDSASWSDGEHVLGFQAGLGVSPAEVYLPPASEWSSVAPAWAKELRADVVRDFVEIKVKVVDTPGTCVLDNYRRLGVDP